METYNRFTLRDVPEALTYDDINIIPRASDIESRKDVSTKTRLVGDIYLENPVVPANMDSITDIDMMVAAAKAGSIAFLHRFMRVQDTLDKMDYFYTRTPYSSPLGISVGVSEIEQHRAEQVIAHFKAVIARAAAPASSLARLVILVDVAHGDHTQVYKMVGKIRTLIQKQDLFGRVFIIAGNIATYEAAVRLIDAGAHGLKVGVGNGSLCETRIRTGAGVPQVSAILEVVCARHALTGQTPENRVTVMADGGVKYPGDIVKALWLGADSVMTGYMFAGTYETPGAIIKKGLFPNEREFKIYRGSASMASKADRGETGNVEGNIKEVPVKGPAAYIFQQIKEGVQSGFSYGGSLNVDEFRATNRVVKITSNGVLEARPNLIEQ